MRRHRLPRASHGLTPLPHARLHLPKPVRSLAHSCAASPLRQSRAPQLCLSPRPRTRRRNPPLLLHLSRQSHARSSALPSFKSCSRLRRLPSSGRAASSLATDGHGAAVLGRHGSHLPSLLQPRLATLPHSPSSHTSHAPASSPCLGRRWPPASWPSRAAAPARTPARHSASANQAGQAESGHGPAVPFGPAQQCLNELFSFILYYLKFEMV